MNKSKKKNIFGRLLRTPRAALGAVGTFAARLIAGRRECDPWIYLCMLIVWSAATWFLVDLSGAHWRWYVLSGTLWLFVSEVGLAYLGASIYLSHRGAELLGEEEKAERAKSGRR